MLADLLTRRNKPMEQTINDHGATVDRRGLSALFQARDRVREALQREEEKGDLGLDQVLFLGRVVELVEEAGFLEQNLRSTDQRAAR